MPNQLGYEVVGKADQELLHRLQEAENVRINQEVLPERAWWEAHVIQDEDAALRAGVLMVVPEVGANYSLRRGLINNSESKTVRHVTFKLLVEIQSRWQKAMLAKGENIDDIYLAVISLYRSPEAQQQVMQETYLASRGLSAHGAGAAIDFDPNGYYFGDGRESVQCHMSNFRSVYTLTLMRVLEQLVSERACHVIWEKGIKIEGDVVIRYDACYHVCVAPDFQLDMRVSE